LLIFIFIVCCWLAYFDILDISQSAGPYVFLLTYLRNCSAELQQIIFVYWLWLWCRPSLAALWYVTCFCFVDNVMFSHSTCCCVTRIFLSGENITGKTTASITTKFWSTIKTATYELHLGSEICYLQFPWTEYQLLLMKVSWWDRNVKVIKEFGCDLWIIVRNCCTNQMNLFLYEYGAHESQRGECEIDDHLLCVSDSWWWWMKLTLSIKWRRTCATLRPTSTPT